MRGRFKQCIYRNQSHKRTSTIGGNNTYKVLEKFRR